MRLDCNNPARSEQGGTLRIVTVQGVVKHVSAVGLSEQHLRNAVIISRKEKRDAQTEMMARGETQFENHCGIQLLTCFISNNTNSNGD